MSDVREKLKQAIFGQESSYGKADTSKPNSHGVQGPMQIKDTTWAGMVKLGLIPGDWKIDNPDQNKQAGFKLVDHLMDKFGNDPAKAAAAYYAGERVVKPDGTIQDFRDLKNPKAPGTHQYVQQVLARAGLGDGRAAATSAAQQQIDATPAPAPIDTSKPLRERGLPERTFGRAQVPERAQPTVAPADPLPQANPAAASTVVETGAAVAAQRADAIRNTDFGDRVQVAFLDTPLGAVGRNIIDRTVRDELQAQPGFKPSPATWGPRSEDEIHELLEAQSPEAEQRILWSQGQRRDRMETTGSGGLGKGLLAGLVAGLPEGLISGALVYKGLQLARVGSAALAAQGRAGAALASSTLENVGVNVATTAMQDAIEGYQGPAEYAFGAAFGMIGTGAAAFGIKADVANFHAERIAKQAATDIAAKAERAAAKLGEGATKEDILAEIKRMEIEEAEAPVRAAESPLPRTKRLIDVDEEGNVRGDAEQLPGDEARPATVAGQNSYRAIGDSTRPAQTYATEALFDQYDPRTNPAAQTHISELAAKAGIGRDDVMRAIDGKQPLITRGLTPTEEATVAWVKEKFFSPDVRMLVGAADSADTWRGQAVNYRDVAMINVNTKGLDPTTRSTVLVHELGHALFQQNYRKMSSDIKRGALAEYDNWLRTYHGRNGESADVAYLQRSSLGEVDRASMGTRTAVMSGSMQDGSLFEYMSGLLKQDGTQGSGNNADWAKYWGNFEEMTAEQFGKYIEASIDSGRHSPPAGLVKIVKDLFAKLFSFFQQTKDRGLLAPTEGFNNFFEAVFKQHKAGATRAKREAAGLDPYRNAPAGRVAGTADEAAPAADDVAVRNGLDLLPEGTPSQRAEKKAIVELYRKAEDPTAAWNNIDPRFIASLTDNRVFNVASTSLLMLKSPNPVVRMLAAELLESPTGAAGRQATAAIAKHILERKFMGNAINDFQAAYTIWRNENGGNLAKDAFDGKHWEDFNHKVAEYVESRRDGSPLEGSVHPAVAKAAAVVEEGYERMRVSQKQNETLGHQALPETSAGYMPHKMSPGRVQAMTPQEAGKLHTALVDQFIQIEGWDVSFSANLASKYIERVRARALGDYESTMNVHGPGATEILEESFKAMGMAPDEISAMVDKLKKGGPGHTKRRIRLDLNADQGDGFKLMDLFETDQLKLLRSQAQRVSGEVALARHGVMGRPGLKLLRRAASYGSAETKADMKELEALDQVAAEMLGEPFGAHQGRWIDRAIQFNALARLGGMGFTQLAEYINGVAHVGVARTLSAVGDMRRLRAEILKMAKGEKVDNPIIGSLESYAGAEFGTDSYKLVFPFDNHDVQYQIYGRDSVTAADRLLRGGAHVQAKLSLWRAIHSAQQRGMAEQIVRKTLEAVRTGQLDDIALRDMGFGPNVMQALTDDLDAAAKFDPSGRLLEFDITKMRDTAAAEEFVQAVHRGGAQIIQGTFVGETGKWAHSGILRLITQFRTFSITSVEKQWGRQTANRGAAAALGILMGSMAMAAPIYMARVALASVGREDQDEYLEKHLAPAQIARATMNYVALTGLTGDMLDALTAATGVGKVTGGRSGAGTEFVGNVVAPSLGLVDDVWKSLQNTKEGTDPSDFLKTLPLSNLPYMKPLINTIGD